MKHYLSPSLMCCDLLNVERDLHILEKTGMDMIHYDIMDTSIYHRHHASGPDAGARGADHKPADGRTHHEPFARMLLSPGTARGAAVAM